MRFMTYELRLNHTRKRWMALISVMAFAYAAVGQDQKKTDAQSQQQPTNLEQILEQNHATETTRRDARELNEVLKENKQEAQSTENGSQNIWNQSIFGTPCNTGTCGNGSTLGSAPKKPSMPGDASTQSPCGGADGRTQPACPAGVGDGSGRQPKSATNPCGTEGACPPSVGNGGDGPKPATNPCGTKGACPPSVGDGGGQGPKLPINPCAAMNSCGPGVGGDGGVYDDKALQIMLYTNVDQLTQSKKSGKSGEATKR